MAPPLFNLTDRLPLYTPYYIAVNFSKSVDDYPTLDGLKLPPVYFTHGDRFSSAIFQVSTVAGQVAYAVHKTCLRKSPVFAKMCHLGFKEAVEKRITLPAKPLNSQNNSSSTNRALELGHLYVSAIQYGLEAIKDIIVAKLRLCHQSKEFSDWLQVALIIYESDPSRDDPYPIYIRSLIAELLKLAEKSAHLVNETLKDRTDTGGPLAVDIHVLER
ncbi:MAG: hypothetical protein Q9199_001766 [Rusavskia elegans]